MSLIFLIAFIMTFYGEVPEEYFADAEVFVVWALFAIADALWVRGRR